MSEPCVCGHLKSSHHGHNIGCEHEVDDHLCGCMEFREAVDWPTQQGWWWCRSGLFDTLAHAKVVTKEMRAERGAITGMANVGDVVVTIAAFHGLTDGYFIRDYCEHEYGLARFVRLTEQSPFPPTEGER